MFKIGDIIHGRSDYTTRLIYNKKVIKIGTVYYYVYNRRITSYAYEEELLTQVYYTDIFRELSIIDKVNNYLRKK